MEEFIWAYLIQVESIIQLVACRYIYSVVDIFTLFPSKLSGLRQLFIVEAVPSFPSAWDLKFSFSLLNGV